MEADEYRKLAEVEDRMWYFAALHGHLRRALREWAGGGTGVAASAAVVGLDAGCGTGGFLRGEERAAPDWRWQGVDAEELAVRRARERTRHPVQRGRLEALPFGEAAFDAVVCADVLYHVDDDGAALRELRRVLRPGGRVVINVPAYRWLWSYHDEAVHSRRRYGRRELVAKLAAAGFGEIATTHWNLLPLPLVVVRRKLWPAPATASDVHLYPAPVERAFRGLMTLERAWLRRVGPLAAGSSILAVARRPAGGCQSA